MRRRDDGGSGPAGQAAGAGRRRSGLSVGLAGLRQGRKLVVEGVVGSEPEFWEGAELRFSEPVRFSGVAELAGDGLVVRGSWSACLAYDCGRCLKPLQVPMTRTVVLVYSLNEEWERDDPDVRAIDAGASEADLEKAIREDVILEAPRYVLPEAGGDGRCTRCGEPVGRPEKTPSDEKRPDPRWAALEALKTD